MNSAGIVLFFVLVLSTSLVSSSTPSPPSPIVLRLNARYQQDFDELASQGTAHPFPPSTGTLATGWWASDSTYASSDGTEASGGLFSFGELNAADRALGSLTSNKYHHTAWGAAFQLEQRSAAEGSLWALQIQYTGEQWSVGSNSSSVLVFDYCIVSQQDYQENRKWGFYDETPGLWMVKDQLSFTSPIVGGDPRPLNGNEPQNRIIMAHSLAIDDWSGSKIVQLRWTHRNSGGRDHALALDDLSIDLVRLKLDQPNPSKHRSPWFYVGIIVAGVTVLLAVAGLIVVLIIKRKRNSREGQEAYSLLQGMPSSSSTSSLGGEDNEALSTDNTSINPTSSPVAGCPIPGLYGVYALNTAIATGHHGDSEPLSFGSGEQSAEELAEDEEAANYGSHGVHRHDHARPCIVCKGTGTSSQ